MDAAFFRALQAALHPEYRLAQELHGGGMSRVFVAEETALGRTVVVKVLPPELARAMSLERFRREIQLAASLQHPHIVPLLLAGDVRVGAAGTAPVLYYTMPFVDGEALEARLRREGALPVPDVLTLLHDIADALAHAHERGVVHRDLKPGNVLLARRHALLTDFGIAKAIHAAAPGAHLSGGVALGTPAYMAPEQALGDPDVDHRADLYAFGVLAYEMLTGRPPFSGLGPQQLLAAHVSRVPEPPTRRRPELSEALAALVMDCLAKEPSDRPPSADVVRQRLEAAQHELVRREGPPAQVASSAAAPQDQQDREAPPNAVPAQIAPRAAPGRRRGLAIAAALVLAAGGGVASHLRAGRAADPLMTPDARVLVAPFDNRTDDSTLGLTIGELVRVDLAQSPRLRVLPPEGIRAGLRRMQHPDTATLTPPLARELAQREGVCAIVTGEIARVGDRFTVVAHLVQPDGTELAAVRESAESPDALLPAVDRLARRLRSRAGESIASIAQSPPLAQVTTPSLAALRSYTLAARAVTTGHEDAALRLLDDAVRADSGFASAWRLIGAILGNSGRDRTRMLEARERAYLLRDRLPARERFLVEATYHRRVTGDLDRAAAAYRQLLAQYPDDATALNNFGFLQAELGRTDSAIGLFQRALTADSMMVLAYGNLADAQLTLRDVAGTDATHARWARRLGPSSRWRAQRALRHWVAGERDSALQQAAALGRDSTVDGSYRAIMLLYGSGMAAAMGRMADADRLERTLEALGAGAVAERTAARISHATRLALVLGRPAEARRALAALLDSPLWRTQAPLDRPHVAVALAMARAGGVAQARALLAEDARVRRSRAAVGRPMRRERADSAAFLAALGAIRLAEGDPAAAARLFDQADTSGVAAGWYAADAALAFEHAGQPEAAIARYHRYLAFGYPYRVAVDAVHLHEALSRLATLLAARGEQEAATVAAGRAAALWAGGDRVIRAMR